MKGFNKFIDTAPYWKVYLVSAFLVAVLTYILFSCVVLGEKPFTHYVVVKISIAFGLFVGLFICLTASLMRKSSKFWEATSAFEQKIEEAKTQKELEDLYRTEFKELAKSSDGSIFTTELKRLDAILRTKHKYVK